ncbi:O-antigen ligase family protein [Actinomycetospora sp. CA-084318]|uniref:O-antigen ligase family protein n=1 Tax=Actinomycetospora sp. CA-084318 TaxID=3239892 RepID=UPI003D96215D
MALIVAVAIALGTCVRLTNGRLEAWVHRAVPAAFLLGLVLIDQFLRPAVTSPGKYAVLEQIVLLTCLIAMLIGGRRRGLDRPDDADAALHVALVWVSLVAGADGLRALSTADAESLAARQAAGIFGASNYIAALLALATVACVHRACTGRGRPILNIAGAIVFIAMAAPQASRTSTVVFAVVVLVVLVRHRQHLWFLAVAAATAVLVVVAPTAGVIGRLRSGNAAGGELNGRTELWGVAVDAIRDRPVLGSGAGRLSDSLAASGFGQATYVHDVWLSLVAQFGLVGLVFLVIGTAWILTGPVGSYGRTLAVTGLLLSSTEPVIETMKMGLVFAAVIGVCAAHAQQHDQEGPVRDLGRRGVLFRGRALAHDLGLTPAPGGRADGSGCRTDG